jgi:prepilin-type N-terminal cleavage/methylation domain-containing protein
MNQYQYLRAAARRRVLLAKADSRRGFTLLELLVSMGILLILATLTMRLLNATLDSDRLKTGARELQSLLAGARDRAIYATQPRGVRFIADPTNPSAIRSFVFVGSSNSFTDGAMLTVDSLGNILGPVGTVPTGLPLPATLPLWDNLWAHGALVNGTPIQLTNSSGASLGFATVSPTAFDPVSGNPIGFAITSTLGAGTFPIAAPGVNYTLQLAPAIVSGDEPRTLPQNIVIDLNSSILPASWGAPGAFASTLDVMFSPQGTVIGAPASDGRIHFVLADITDSTGVTPITSFPARSHLQLNSPWQPTTTYALGNVVVPTPSNFVGFRCTTAGTSGGAIPAQFATAAPNQSIADGGVQWLSFVRKNNVIVSLATASGRVTTHPVDVATQLNPPVLPAGSSPGYDSFRFAEIGEVTQ